MHAMRMIASKCFRPKVSEFPDRSSRRAGQPEKYHFEREPRPAEPMRALCKGRSIGYAFVTEPERSIPGFRAVEVGMPMGVGSFGAVFSEAADRRSLNRPKRRAVFLFGTSLLVYAALPSAAVAQSECGAPPAGGGGGPRSPPPHPFSQR